MRADVYADLVATRIEGPLLFLKRTVNVGLNEAVEVVDAQGNARLGRIAALNHETLTVEVLESTSGLDLDNTRVRFRGEPLTFAVGPDLLGRVFDGVGRTIDDGPPVAAAEMRRRIDGRSINPAARTVPTDFIETGVSTIDLMNSLVRGQKLPIFSGAGLPHDLLAIQIARQARLRDAAAGEFALVFVAIGVSYDTAEHFRREMEDSGVLEHTVLFLNLASDSSTQRLLAPRYALDGSGIPGLRCRQACAGGDVGHDQLLRGAARGVRQSWRGAEPQGLPGLHVFGPGHPLRAGRQSPRTGQGSLTQLPILTMPSDDITHPIPDLTGYITEGQIVLDRDLDRTDIYPPVNVLPCLSRLMKDGTGEGFTHADHPALANQLYAAYARAVHMRVLASVVGREGLAEVDRQFLDFGDRFERQLVNQQGARSLEQSMALGWQLLRTLAGIGAAPAQ